jgi:type IV pilus assembly protein PilN
MGVKLRINLASEPFRRDRPIVAASIAVGLLLVGSLAMLTHLAVAERAQMADTRAAVAKLEAQVRTLSVEQSKLENVARRPENAEVLERSLLLNTLLQRKGISWTKIFSDLEEVIPHNVRLVSVRPEVNAQNEISLQMVVGATSSEPVLQLIMTLEKSPQFGPTSVPGWLPPSQNEPLYRYRVSVSYAQRM